VTTGPIANFQLKPCILIGAGGHARVVKELAELCGANILGVCDPKFEGVDEQEWNGLQVLGGDTYLTETNPETVLLLNGIGMLPGNGVRESVYQRFTEMGFRFPSLVHPFAWVSASAIISEGAQIMAGVVVQPGASIGENTIVNTRSSIDHDSHLGAHCHLAPGALLCGEVEIGDSSFIGAGSTVIHTVLVASGKVIKAGSLTISDVN
jgi:UDP-perosamine 4-acetyltransferase